MAFAFPALLPVLRHRLTAAPELLVEEWTARELVSPTAESTLFHPEWILPQLRESGDALRLRWHSRARPGQPPRLSGFVDLLPLPESHRDWCGILYFDFHTQPDEAWRRAFKIVDNIGYGIQACVGIYHTAAQNPQLYYYEYEDTPSPLGVDLAGYLELLGHSLGGEHWQLVVLELLASAARPYVPASAETAAFVAHMQALAPSFQLRELVDCFDRVRLPAAAAPPAFHQLITAADVPPLPVAAASAPLAALPTRPATAGAPLPVPYVWQQLGIAPLAAALHQRLTTAQGVVVTEWTVLGGAADADPDAIEHDEWIAPLMRELAQQEAVWSISWQSQPSAAGGASWRGTINILSLQDIYSDWTYITNPHSLAAPQEEWKNTFKVVDLVFGHQTPRAAYVGLYHTPAQNPQLYYFEYENTPSPLGVDLAGYLELLPYSLGGEHWQLVLLELLASDQRPYEPVSPETRAYVTAMQHLVPAFSLAELVACFDRVRLRS